MNKHNQILLSIRNSKKIINLQGTKYSVIAEIAEDKGFRLSTQHFTFYWTDCALAIRQIRDLPESVKVNHLPDIVVLTRKNLLAHALNRMHRFYNKDYDFYPETYVLPMDYSMLLKCHRKSRCYIVKPENGCQGKGIYLTDNPQTIDKSSQAVVQHYIPNPLLIDGLKFDIRVYILVTCVQPLRIYLYKDGLARFATNSYKNTHKDNLKDLYQHLTNYSINKNHQNFRIYENSHNVGHKRLLSSLFNSSALVGLYEKVSQLVVKSIISVLPNLQNSFRLSKKQCNACFQLLGYDFLMTDSEELKLLEVNQNPSLNTETSVDRVLKSQMVANIFDIIEVPLLMSEDCRQDPIKLKDKHEMSRIGNFMRIYPAANLQATEKYDKFINKSLDLVFQRKNIKDRSREINKCLFNGTPVLHCIPNIISGGSIIHRH